MITRIREVRKAKGLTLEQVGALCVPPTTAQTIGRLETGTRTVSVNWLNRIARALGVARSEEHTSELQSLMRISYAVFCLKKKNKNVAIPHLIDKTTHETHTKQAENTTT